MTNPTDELIAKLEQPFPALAQGSPEYRHAIIEYQRDRRLAAQALRTHQQSLAQAVLAERERCARVAEHHRFPQGWVGNDGQVIIAAAIRNSAAKGED